MAFIQDFDGQPGSVHAVGATQKSVISSDASVRIGGSPVFWSLKRWFDIGFSIALLPLMLICAAVILLLNPFFNPGRLFFVQARMGQDCKAFGAIKFRTMTDARVERGPEDPIETHRITPLGGVLRKLRIDELPQILNVLAGDMSLMGPRPDYFGHARSYVRAIPQYRDRHSVRPGISGLAQIQVGYVEGTEATRLKVQADLDYIQNAGLRMELWVFWRTLVTIFRRKGA
jgi:lipopolysaccharide/colanic/teichoic acid biosynthesis glycosyltransferase